MKRKILLLTLFLSFLIINVFSQTVYITKTGTKYHSEGCRYLSKSKIAIDVTEAINKGFEACNVCKPQAKNSSSNAVKTNFSNTEASSQKNKSANSASPSTSVQCSATTKAGTRCKRMTKSANKLCWQHGGN